MDEIEHFEIRTDVICHYYKGFENPIIREILADFLISEKKWERTSVLYKDMIDRHERQFLLNKLPDKDRWLNEGFVTGPCAWEMKKQMEDYIDTTDAPAFNVNLYHFYAHTYPNTPPQMAVILNQKVVVDINLDPGVFKFFFAVIYKSSIQPAVFLDYHLDRTFKNDLPKARLFLREVEKDHQDLIGPGIRLIDEWLLQRQQTIKKSDLTHREEILKLQYLKEAGVIDKLPTATELRTNFGQKRYEASLSLSQAKKRSGKYRQAKKEELQNVLKTLQHDGEIRAASFVERDLIKFNKGLEI